MTVLGNNSLELATASCVQSKPRWFLSRHALDRATQMGLDRARVVEALHEPDVEWPSHQGRRIAVRESLAVVFEPASHVVITVLWHTEAEWSRDPDSDAYISLQRVA